MLKNVFGYKSLGLRLVGLLCFLFRGRNQRADQFHFGVWGSAFQGHSVHLSPQVDDSGLIEFSCCWHYKCAFCCEGALYFLKS